MEVENSAKGQSFCLVGHGRKNLTWDILQKRGWKGPGYCSLCKADNESINHIFIICPFAKAVWNALTQDLNLKRSWMGVTLVECMKNWTKDKSVPSYLAAYAMWYIWQERNKTLFEDIKPSVKTVLYKILAHPLCKTTNPKDKLPKDIMIDVDLNTTLAWFDGAAKSDGSMCGAGGIIKVQKETVYKWKLNCGKGTNTKAELMGAWASLWIAEFLKLFDLHLLGDSKVVIDWLKKEGSLQVGTLGGLES
jgi:hypothetical protein